MIQKGSNWVSVVNISRDMTFFKLKNLEKTYNYIRELEPAYYDSLLVGVSHMPDKIDCYLWRHKPHPGLHIYIYLGVAWSSQLDINAYKWLYNGYGDSLIEFERCYMYMG